MAEAIFAGEEIKELPLEDRLAGSAALLAELARLAENLLLGDGPSDAGNGDGQNEQPDDLSS
jgi:hypothetical protein